MGFEVPQVLVWTFWRCRLRLSRLRLGQRALCQNEDPCRAGSFQISGNNTLHTKKFTEGQMAQNLVFGSTTPDWRAHHDIGDETLAKVETSHCWGPHGSFSMKKTRFMKCGATFPSQKRKKIEIWLICFLIYALSFIVFAHERKQRNCFWEERSSNWELQ